MGKVDTFSIFTILIFIVCISIGFSRSKITYTFYTMRKLQNDGITTGEEGFLDEEFDPIKEGVGDDKLDIESFSDEDEDNQY